MPVVPKPVLARVWILHDAVAGTGIQPVGATARAKSATACKRVRMSGADAVPYSGRPRQVGRGLQGLGQTHGSIGIRRGLYVDAGGARRGRRTARDLSARPERAAWDWQT